MCEESEVKQENCGESLQASVLSRTQSLHWTVPLSPSWRVILPEPSEKGTSETTTEAESLKGSWVKRVFIAARQMRHNGKKYSRYRWNTATAQNEGGVRMSLQPLSAQEAGTALWAGTEPVCEICTKQQQQQQNHWLNVGYVHLTNPPAAKFSQMDFRYHNRAISQSLSTGTQQVFHWDSEYQHTVSTRHAQGTGIHKKA